MKRLMLFFILVFGYPFTSFAADDYWEAHIYDVTNEEFNTFSQSLAHAGITTIAAWSQSTSIMKLSAGGEDLTSFKGTVKALVQSTFSKLPEFDVVREDPNEMTIETRICTQADNRLGHNKRINAYFGSDMRGVGAGAYAAWIDPGDSYCQTRTGFNCDGSLASGAQITSSLSTWSAMNQCNRWRIRLHHEGTKWEHQSIEKLWVYFSDRIPLTRKNAVRACLTPSEFEYLGPTQGEACDKLNDRRVGLCEKFWP